MKRATRMMIGVLTWAGLASQSATAAPGQCQGDQCIAFEVSIQLESFHETPVIRSTQYSYTNGTSINQFESVVTRAGDSCTKQIKVPRAVYGMITEVMASMASGSPILTPAQQTVMLFYTTLMQQTLGFNCETRDLDGEPVVIGNGVTVNGSTTNTGGTVVPDVPTSRITGVMQLGQGDWQILVVEAGQSRSVSIGGILLGGWRVISIGLDQVVVERAGEQRVLVVGSLY